MKRIIAAIMVLVSVMTLSGCKQVPSFMPSYWDGLTKRGAQEYIQNALQEKYGEEFVVVSMGIRSSQYHREVVANCSPKSNKDIIFQIEAHNFGKRYVYDGYIQSIVRQEMKNNIDSVLTKYFDKFVVEVDVRGLSDSYDSGIRKAEDATIKNYSEALPNSNKTHIWVALNSKEIGEREKVKKAVNEMAADFFFNVCIY